MNLSDTDNNLVRMNITIPEALATHLKKSLPSRSISRFLAEAAREKMESMEKEKALKELLAAPSSFRKIKDSVKYVRKLRLPEERRLKRLSL